jgi:hypothetical protein
MKIKKTIKVLKELSQSSQQKGYLGDATMYSFQSEVLILLEVLTKGFKGLEKQMKYLWQTLDELKQGETKCHP